MLEKGSDGQLKNLAKKEVEGLTEPLEQVEVGDGWWDVAEKDNGNVAQEIKQHATTVPTGW